MGTFKNKAGNFVLKLFNAPGSLSVALITFAATEARLKMILVMIGVAGKAAFLLQLGKIVFRATFTIGGVTFFAGCLCVFTNQLIACLTLVIEFGVFPAHIVVTKATFFFRKFIRKKVNVVFFMTFFAGRA
jgi:hypothetical protein